VIERNGETNASAKNILFLVGDLTEDYEVMMPFQALTMLGRVVHGACPGERAWRNM